MAGRAPRAGFIAYAALLVLSVAAGLWRRHVVDGLSSSEDWLHVESLLTAFDYAFHALGAASAVALVAVARAPRAARTGGLAMAAASLEGFDVLVAVGQRVLVKSWTTMSSAHLDAVLRAVSAVTSLAYFAATALVVATTARVGRAAAAPRIAPIAWGGVGLVGVRVVLVGVTLAFGERAWKLPGFGRLEEGLYYLSTAVVVAVCIAAALVVGRIAAESPAHADAAPGDARAEALPDAWRHVSGGIALYLGAAGARVLCALLAYGVMAGASGAYDYTTLHTVRDGVVSVAFFSGLATVAMLAGVWRISRAPVEAGGSGPAMVALVLMVLGFAGDLVSTGITADALGGSASAAFFAMDALPVVAFFSAAFGVGAAVSLLYSFRNMAFALGHQDLGTRARATSALTATTGVVACMALLALTHMPTELLLLLAIILLPLAGASLVQFLRVAIPLGRAIRARLAPQT
jgi:hypothetical protein